MSTLDLLFSPETKFCMEQTDALTCELLLEGMVYSLLFKTMKRHREIRQ
jgi:hypothetical protein